MSSMRQQVPPFEIREFESSQPSHAVGLRQRPQSAPTNRRAKAGPACPDAEILEDLRKATPLFQMTLTSLPARTEVDCQSSQHHG
jgi:hypothetical protein